MMVYTIDSWSGILKCENILECEFVMLSERRKCKKVVAWSSGFGMGQYVS